MVTQVSSLYGMTLVVTTMFCIKYIETVITGTQQKSYFW